MAHDQRFADRELAVGDIDVRAAQTCYVNPDANVVRGRKRGRDDIVDLNASISPDQRPQTLLPF
jgi:hypothetical protein